MTEKNTNLEGLVRTAIEKIKEVVDVETVVGKPITVPNGTIIIPVSKIAVGFGSGGSDIPAKSEKELFRSTRISIDQEFSRRYNTISDFA